jgi:hypothetical protein
LSLMNMLGLSSSWTDFFKLSCSWHFGTHHIENTSFATVSLLLCAYSFRREHVYQTITQNLSLYIRPLHSNGRTCYTVIIVIISLGRKVLLKYRFCLNKICLEIFEDL